MQIFKKRHNFRFGAILNMAGFKDCSVCFQETKYSCLKSVKCDLPICNLCGIKELNEEIEGRKAGKKVGYCPDCKVIGKHKGGVNGKKLDVAFARGMNIRDDTSKPLREVNTPASERYVHVAMEYFCKLLGRNSCGKL